VDAGLDEIDYGAWTGRAFAELDSDPNWTRWNVSRADAAPPEGEAMHIVQARACARLSDWIGKHSGEIVVAVTHGDIIKALVCHLLGLSLNRILTFDVDQASITTLLLWPGGGKVVHLNATLPGEEAQ
jgi:probable phosphoglycerate mutase